MTSKYILLQDLEVYELSRRLSKIGWEIYEKFNWEMKKIMGFQFIEAIDSVGANIAEGYSRFHYLDKIKFYYNARASLSEATNHWIELMNERNIVDKELCKNFKATAAKLFIKLNNFINSTYRAKSQIQST